MKLSLNENKTKLIIESHDFFGGCYHEISVMTVLMALKPILPKFSRTGKSK